MKNILVFYQNSTESVFIRTLVGNYAQNHKVYLITTSPEGFLHHTYQNTQVVALSIANNKSIWNQIYTLVKFCHHNKIDFVFPHLQRANLIALIAQYFIKAKVVPTRHHIDDVRLGTNINAKIEDKLVNLLSRTLIVLSEKAKKDIIDNENLSSKRVIVLPLMYNFNLYKSPNLDFNKKNIDIQKNSKVIITIGRINQNKRTELALYVLEKLIENQQDYYWIVLGDGPNMDSLSALINNSPVSSRVRIIGNTDKALDYLQLADWLIHPSISESSCQVIKEAGILSKPVIVCENVGDFEEYLVDNQNAYIVSKNNFVNETVEKIISSTIFDKTRLGKNLKETILNHFSLDNIKTHYDKFIEDDY